MFRYENEEQKETGELLNSTKMLPDAIIEDILKRLRRGGYLKKGVERIDV